MLCKESKESERAEANYNKIIKILATTVTAESCCPVQLAPIDTVR
jgi:hypothetical protein